MNTFRGIDRDWTEQYALVGQFVVEFEWSCYYLRFQACALLQMYGLNKWGLSEIIFNQRAFTADPLINCYASLMAECLGPKHELSKDLDRLRKDFIDLIQIRNELLHASYLIGPEIDEFTHEDKPRELHIEKRTPNKDGAQVKIVAQTLAEIQAKIDKAIELKWRIKEFFSKFVIALNPVPGDSTS